jgi:phage/plasmid-like protein (TIGR03299 family)
MHALTERKDGFVEMAYVGDKPWHGLGQELAQGASIDHWKVQAGMDWRVKRAKVRYPTNMEGTDIRTMDDQHVLFRSDNKEALGVVSDKYKVVQPDECLEFFRDIVGSNGFELHTAGTMFGGRRFWALASIGEGATILGRDDLVNGYLLLSTSADGTLATTAKFTTVRVVCNNTLSMALSAKDARDIKISHRTSFNADAVKAELGIVKGAFGQFINASKKLAVTMVSTKEAHELTAALLVDSKAVTKADVTASSGYKSILSLFDHGKGNHGETAWDWVNGVTEYVDHVQRAKTDSHRMANSMFGKGDALKTMAFERALAIAE